ncbi:MAG: MCP four helix bundle domain-containing protein [Candidatus Wallbacteria bacterium]|nr:MCP four helix bundle domain-containing protein [Candidatus Wallbacteria bacterium]
MTRSWTFGQKIGFGFAAILAITFVICVVTYKAMGDVVETKDRVIARIASSLVDVERLSSGLNQQIAAMRGYVLSREDEHASELREARTAISQALERLAQSITVDSNQRLRGQIEKLELDYESGVDAVFSAARSGATTSELVALRREKVTPVRRELDSKITALTSGIATAVQREREDSTRMAERASRLVLGLAVLSALTALALAVFLTRALATQIGSAVQHVQSSSAELQTAANQQATGAREQSTAMAEISTTISELLATGRQIAESARRVAQIAGETSGASREGDQIVVRARDSIEGIKRQVDLITTHMLDLGGKSQQIGGILDVINELSEQTNILAINASIEAAGAGEAGKRFAVVADEIRKLADRVGGSTKEIRRLIDEVRAAVNTTVMATEGGAKAVDAGTRQFSDVTTSFRRITDLVVTTTEAAREIELSTKQQASAVEQVSTGVGNVAQATAEMETSAAQTLQTATQLTRLSHDLARLVRADADPHGNW